jgi:hypothetical protein
MGRVVTPDALLALVLQVLDLPFQHLPTLVLPQQPSVQVLGHCRPIPQTSRRLGRPRREGVGDAAEDAVPVDWLFLAKEAVPRVPRRVVPLQQPAPVGHRQSRAKRWLVGTRPDLRGWEYGLRPPPFRLESGHQNRANRLARAFGVLPGVPVGFDVAADDVGDFQAGLQVSLGSRVREAGLGGTSGAASCDRSSRSSGFWPPTVCRQASAVAG